MKESLLTNGVVPSPSKEPEQPVSALKEETRHRVYKDAGWRFSREGDTVHGENMRMTYTCKIGEVYTLRASEGARAKSADGPKRLVDVSFLGGKWRAATEATAANDRDRVMDLNTFMSRYVEGTPKARKRERRASELTGGNRLARIEAKLDLLLTSLGVKYEEKT